MKTKVMLLVLAAWCYVGFGGQAHASTDSFLAGKEVSIRLGDVSPRGCSQSNTLLCEQPKSSNKLKGALLLTGGIMFGASYSTSALFSLMSADRFTAMIPLVGPFVSAYKLFGGEVRNKMVPPELEGTIFLVLGSIQVISLGLLIAGLVLPHHKNPMAFEYGNSKTVQVTPVVSANMMGFSINGTM